MEFHVTTDFRDDFTQTGVQWNEARLREFVQLLAQKGFTAIHWIGMGDASMGKWDAGGMSDEHGHAQAFVKEVPNPLGVLCEEAHAHGLKVHAVPKIFDMALCVPQASYAEGLGPRPMTGPSQLGMEGMGWRWLNELADKRMELHPRLQERGASQSPISTIRLWHEDATLTDVPDLCIMVSEHNHDYEPYAGTFEVTTSVRRRRLPVYAPAPETRSGEESEYTCIEIEGLNISQPFVAVVPEAPLALANTLAAMVEVEFTEDRVAPFTYGLVARRHWSDPQEVDWRVNGIAFDCAFGTPVPGRGWQRAQSGGRFRVDVAEQGFAAIARGRNRFLTGMAELAYPDVREALLDVIRYQLDSGVDAVDIRFGSHTESLDWENYGFSPPILDAFKERHGVDIAAGDVFDREAWQALRGEYADAFVTSASELIRSRGKEVWAHLHGRMEAPDDGCWWYGIRWRWRQWVEKGLVDGLNFRGYGFKAPLYSEGMAVCDAHGIRRMVTPALHSTADEGWRTYVPELTGRGRTDGFNAFNVYESAAIMRLEEDGFHFRDIPIWDEVEAARA